MKCPECKQGKLKTVETFQTDDSTLRTKLCCYCEWKFTTVEKITEAETIPNAVRRPKKVKEAS